MIIRFDYLTAIADLLEKLPDDRVDMLMWEEKKAMAEFNPETLECGFAGCAIGWAITAGIIPGLKWMGTHPVDRAPYYHPDPEEFAEQSWMAVEAALGLNENQAMYLFNADYYVPDENKEPRTNALIRMYSSKPNVIARIRRFIETGGVVGQ